MQQNTIATFKSNQIQKKVYEVCSRNNTSPEAVRGMIIEALDISSNQLSFWLSNNSQPPIEDFFKLAQVLECKIDDLVQ